LRPSTIAVYKWRAMTNPDLAAEFDALGPWVTKFVVDGEPFGGEFEVANDTRPGQFHAAFPHAKTILELGSFEGGHTAWLARLDATTHVIGLEGRPENIARARFVLELLGVTNAEVRQANLEELDLTTLGRFDAVFNSGLLYHLPRPWELLERIARVTDSMFLSTHYCTDDSVDATEHGYRGFSYHEHGYEDPLSGLAPTSFWPTRDALLAMVAAAGFTLIDVTWDEVDHPHGPLICLNARAPKRRWLPRRRRPQVRMSGAAAPGASPATPR